MTASNQQVFISYQRTDAAFARQVREHLVVAGVRAWMDQFDIPVGAYWPDEIDKALLASDIVVGILSSDAVESRNVKNEWDWAIQNDKRLLLLQVSSCPVPHRYISINFIDATTQDPASALDALLGALGIARQTNDDFTPPETQYARLDDIHIAYQVVGDGPIDLVFVPGFVSNVEYIWEMPAFAEYYRRLASVTRLIIYDKRGTGLSDPIVGAPTLEQRMDDTRAVMDAAGSDRAVLMGVSDGGPMSLLFAATYPERTLGLILYGTYARRAWGPDYPWGRNEEEVQELLDAVERDWGNTVDPVGLRIWAPSFADDAQAKQNWATMLRRGASPGGASAILRLAMELDTRDILPSIRVPTLVIHKSGDRVTRIENGRYLAEHIPHAKLVELPGDDHNPLLEDLKPMMSEIESFLTTVDPAAQAVRIIFTVLSLRHANETDAAHQQATEEPLNGGLRDHLNANGVTHIDVRDEQVIATFDGPSRAIRCAASILSSGELAGLEMQAGVHTGEIEIAGNEVRGMALDIASAVAATAQLGEVIASRTVKDLVAGSGIVFEDRGIHAFGGIPDEWQLFRVDPESV